MECLATAEIPLPRLNALRIYDIITINIQCGIGIALHTINKSGTLQKSNNQECDCIPFVGIITQPIKIMVISI